MKSSHLFWIALFLALLASVLLLVAMTIIQRMYQNMILAENQQDKREEYEKHRTIAVVIQGLAFVLIIISIGLGGYARSQT